MKPIIKRSISGLILVVVIVECTVASKVSFVALWSLIGLLTLWEFYSLLKKSGAEPQRCIPMFTGAVALLTTAIYGAPQWIAIIPLLALIAVVEIFRKGSKAFENLAYSYLGLIYVVLPVSLLTTIDPMMVLCYITLVWINDTGAYLTGTAIGRHKMAPEISPKKSWEGFWGGVLFAMGAALVWYGLYWSDQSATLTTTFGDSDTLGGVWTKLLWLGLGLVTAMTGVAGDLLESKFKRSIGVKDSGKLIPGHGGMLDRFDAMLLSAPFVWSYLALTGII